MKSFLLEIDKLKNIDWDDFYQISLNHSKKEIGNFNVSSGSDLKKFVSHNFNVIWNSCVDIKSKLDQGKGKLSNQIIEITETLEFQLEALESYKRGHYAVSFSILRVINELIIHTVWTGFDFPNPSKFNYSNFLTKELGVDMQDAFGYHELSQHAHYSSWNITARQEVNGDGDIAKEMDIVRINSYLRGNEEIPQYLIFYQWQLLTFLLQAQQFLNKEDIIKNSSNILDITINSIEDSIFPQFSSSFIPFNKFISSHNRILKTLKFTL